MTSIKHNEGKKGLFEIFDGDNLAGEMSYTWAGDTKFIIDHTEVFPGNEGKGFAKQLVMAGVEFARAKNVKILPLCPYAKSLFDKSPDLKDVLF